MKTMMHQVTRGFEKRIAHNAKIDPKACMAHIRRPIRFQDKKILLIIVCWGRKDIYAKLYRLGLGVGCGVGLNIDL